MGKSKRRTIHRLLWGVLDAKAARKALRSKAAKAYLMEEWQKASEYPVSHEDPRLLSQPILPWRTLPAAKREHRRGFLLSPAWQRAAAFLLILILSGIAMLWYTQGGGWGGEDPMKTYATVKGERKRVLLPDGSRVWLNAASCIRYADGFEKGAREVFLDGEACFDVAKSDAPFLVYAGDVRIRVLGTRFNVNAYPEKDRIATTLLEGRLEVSNQSETETETLSLRAGQRASLVKGARTFLIDEVNTKRVSSWIEGRLSFDNTPLSEILPDLSRWFDVPLKLMPAATDDPHFTFTIKEKQVEEVLELLQLTAPITYFKEKDTIVVMTTSVINQANQN